MELKKTDRRFKLHAYGFDYYLNFSHNEISDYLKVSRKFEKMYGEPVYSFEYIYSHKLYNKKWFKTMNRKNTRIFFKDKKMLSLILLG